MGPLAVRACQHVLLHIPLTDFRPVNRAVESAATALVGSLKYLTIRALKYPGAWPSQKLLAFRLGTKCSLVLRPMAPRSRSYWHRTLVQLVVRATGAPQNVVI